MKVTAEDRQAVTALQSIGFTRPAAARMIARGVAHRLRKSIVTNDNPLPTAPNREPGEWTKKTDAENERQDPKPEDKDLKKKAKSNIRLKMKPRKAGDKRPTSPNVSITEKLNGTKWMKVISADGKVTLKQLDKYFIPTYVEEHTDGKQPAKEADTKQEGKKEMKKSQAQRFERLVEVARTAPEKLTAGTRAAVNNYLARNNKPVIEPPAPPRRSWFRQQTLAEVAAEREARTVNTPTQPFIPISEHRRMTTAEIIQYKLEQARIAEAARTEKPAIEDRSGTASFIHFQ